MIGTYAARVFALLASTHHALLDTRGGRAAVGAGALLVVPDLHGEFLEDRGAGSTLPEETPAHHGTTFLSIIVTGGRQANFSHCGSELEGFFQYQNGDITVLKLKFIINAMQKVEKVLKYLYQGLHSEVLVLNH